MSLLSVSFSGLERDRSAVMASEVKKVNEEFRLIFSMAIDYSYNKSLVVNNSGRCELIIQSNIERPTIPEVGRYMTQISAEEAMQLRDRIVALADMPSPITPSPVSGIPLFSVILESEGNSRVRTFDPHVVPKRFQVIGRYIADIEKNAYTNEAAVLRVGFTMKNDQTDRMKALGVTVHVKGIGTEPVTFSNPFSASGRLLLKGVRSDVPDDKLALVHRHAHEFDRAELTDKKKVLAQDNAILNLEPGDGLSLTLEGVLDWPPGQYDVMMILETHGPITDDPHFTIGRISTPVQKLSVTGEPKPEDMGDTNYEPPVL